MFSLGFTSGWDHKHTNALHADSSGNYTSEKTSSISTRDKNHFECDVIDSSVVNGLRQPILYSFILDKPPSYNVFANMKQDAMKKLFGKL